MLGTCVRNVVLFLVCVLIVYVELTMYVLHVCFLPRDTIADSRFIFFSFQIKCLLWNNKKEILLVCNMAIRHKRDSFEVL